VRRFFEEVYNQRRPDIVRAIFAANVVVNGRPMALEAVEQFVASRLTTLLAAFPDIHVTIEDQVAEGDKVSTRRTWHGTHQGEYRGIGPTGKRVMWTQISIVRFAGGKVVEDWVVADELGLLEQLGHVV
jgi:predicted ester cyclase